MNRHLHSVLVLLALVLCAASGPQQSQLTDELFEIRAELEAQAAELGALREQLASSAESMQSTLSYLSAQASASSALDQSMTAAEAAGFTAGINYRSRELLLAGLRAYTRAQRAGLPGAGGPAQDQP